MAEPITTIRLPLPLRLGNVNCYLISAAGGGVLIDTGCAASRAALCAALAAAGCTAAELRLVILTHGDFDHAGNAAYLQRLGVPVAMHEGDVGMVARGDMYAGRQKGNAAIRAIAPLLFGFGRAAHLTPDVLLTEESDLAAYGLAARLVPLPGHSAGSLGILMAGGALFCGDLLDHTAAGPVLNAIMDDHAAAHASLEKLRTLEVSTVYPGHGAPFTGQALAAIR